jgi:S-formylglutathione hydrolase
MSSALAFDEISSHYLPATVPYAVLAPDYPEPLPLCLLLLGAEATRDSLGDLQSVFDSYWAQGVIPPMIIATPTPGTDHYYVEDEAGSIAWDSFFLSTFIPHLCTEFSTSRSVVAGISGGGYGALKLAFGSPETFAAVAAVQPMLEPGVRESEVTLRNRLHHVAGGHPGLVGPTRTASIWESNNPANRALKYERRIRDSGMAIYVDAADNDFLNAHDGAEYLHRVLWDLDLSHEYHLVRNADHGGPTMPPRLRSMFAWLGATLSPVGVDTVAENAAATWLQSGMKGKPPEGATTTNAFTQFMRTRFEPIRAEAAKTDPNVSRRLGRF